MAILVLQHWDTGRPGRLGLTLRDHGFRLDIRRPDRGDPVPGSPAGLEGLVVLGGPQNVGDPLPWLDQESALIRSAHERQLPVIGVCLGCQLIGHALGGLVEAMPAPELGFTTVGLNTTAQVDPVLGGLPWACPQFQSHGRMVTQPPPGATVLASSDACAVQAFRAGLRTYAFQYHFECDRDLIRDYARADAQSLAAAGLNAEAQADAAYEMYARAGDRLCVNLASLLFPLSRKLTA